MEQGLIEGTAALEKAKAELAAGEAAFEKGKNQLQHELEMIWWNLGELEDDAAELQEDKARLDGEAEVIRQKLISVDELKELERKHNSARILLTQIDEVQTMVDEGDSIENSANRYLVDYTADVEFKHKALLLVNILAIAGGFFGVLSMVGAYEWIKNRAVLLLPPLMCMLLAAAADGLNMYIGLGQMYSALFAAIFALLHLLVVLPRNKVVIKDLG